MNTVRRSVRMHVDAGALSGELTVPAGARSLVVFVTGGCGGAHAGRDADIADVLHSRGVGTFRVDLVASDETPSRETRLDIDLLADRLDGVLAWVRNRDVTASLDLGLLGIDTGAAAVLRVLSTADVDGRAAVLLDGRVDLGGDPGDVSLPLLFVVDADHDHLRRPTRRVYAGLGTDPREKNVLWTDADGDAVYATSGWFGSHLPTRRDGTAGHAGRLVSPRPARSRRTAGSDG